MNLFKVSLESLSYSTTEIIHVLVRAFSQGRSTHMYLHSVATSN